ncbi:MAG: hypothetical protein EBW40_08295, partial [Gammaproteobacteria bacterium]|nr:hypothetical protein [Gammaproteobacteria bacterium]
MYSKFWFKRVYTNQLHVAYKKRMEVMYTMALSISEPRVPMATVDGRNLQDAIDLISRGADEIL